MKRLLKFLRITLLVAGCILLLLLGLAFSTAPFWTWYRLGVKEAGISRQPEYIVVLGGGGMPSGSDMMRCWYGARAGRQFPGAKIIVALPGDLNDSLSSLNLMKKELELRGIAPVRIMAEDSGTNTRAEALNVLKILTALEGREPAGVKRSPALFASLLIVTSPEHLCRAVRTFRKAGFYRVGGLPAFEQAIESDLTFNARKLGGRRFVPSVGANITLRYQFWMQMNYELLVIREYTAMAYYRLMGWN